MRCSVIIKILKKKKIFYIFLNEWYAVFQNKSINNVYSFSEEIFISDIFSCFCSLRDMGSIHTLEVVEEKKRVKDKVFSAD